MSSGSGRSSDPGRPEAREARWRAWMTAAQRGDGEAYACLLRELTPWLRGRVRRRVPLADAAEDVVQNVLLAIHRARHTWRPERPLGPWLAAVVRNAVVDHHRALRRRQGREQPLETEPAADPEPPEPGAPLSPELERALAGLPATQREAVRMLHLEDLTVREAASRAGVSGGALKLRAHRGIRALRERIGRRRE